jgi:hypothetical protein
MVGSEKPMRARQDKQTPMARRQGKQYIGSCLTCEEEKVRAMIRQSREITYSNARRAIGPAVLDAWASSMGYIAGPESRHSPLRDDSAVTHHRSRYDVIPCIYIVHERIHHIFI